MNPQLDDRPLDEPELDARLTAAMRRIGADYRPGAVPRSRHAAGALGAGADDAGSAATGSDSTRRRPLATGRGRWAVGVAAAVVVAVGVTGLVSVTRPPSTTPTAPSVSTTVAIPSVAEPIWGDGFVVPPVAAPRWAVQLDGSTGPGELQVLNRYAAWLHSTEPIATRWFVREVGDGSQVDASIVVADHPTDAVDRHAADPDDADGDGVRVVTWADGERRRVMTISGEPAHVAIDALTAAAESWQPLALLAVPDGYREVAYSPFDAWLLPPAIVEPGRLAQGTAWSAGVVVPVDDTAGLVVATAALRRDAQPIPGGWASLAATGWELWFADAATGMIVHLRVPPGLTGDEVAALPAAVSVVPAPEVVEQPLRTARYGSGTNPYGVLERAAPVTSGALPGTGRWLALDATSVGAPEGTRCLVFIGALEGVDGCADGRTQRLAACAQVVGRTDLVVLVTNDPRLTADDVRAVVARRAGPDGTEFVGAPEAGAMATVDGGGLRVFTLELQQFEGEVGRRGDSFHFTHVGSGDDDPAHDELLCTGTLTADAADVSPGSLAVEPRSG